MLRNGYKYRQILVYSCQGRLRGSADAMGNEIFNPCLQLVTDDVCDLELVEQQGQCVWSDGMGDYRDLAIEKLSEQIFKDWYDQLAVAVEASRGIGQEGPAVTCQNLGWAVAWLIKDSQARTKKLAEQKKQDQETQEKEYSDAGFKSCGVSEKHYRVNAFQSVVSGAASLQELQMELTTELRGGGRESFPLQELMMSVACEQRVDWHTPEVRDRVERHIESAEGSFNRIMLFHESFVQKTCQKKWPMYAENLPMDVWGELFKSYWSAESKSRWGGLSQVSTLAIAVAGNLAKKSDRDEMASRKNRGKLSEEMSGELNSSSAFSSLGMSREERLEITTAYEACRDKLPARQRICVELLLQRGIKQVNIAKVMGCGKTNVTNLVQSGLESLRACLVKGDYSYIAEVCK